ncbi:MAG: sulfotransferase [Bacteroidota bacterium]
MEKSVNDIKQLPIFFIVGSPRSGTTLLRFLFDAHPNVTIPLEFPFILYYHKIYGHIKKWTENDLHNFFNEIQKNIQYSFWTIDLWNLKKDELRENLKKLTGSCDYETVCKVVCLHFQSPFPKEMISIIGDKNPGYSLDVPLLKEIFPNAKFIFITRDYRDQIQSIRKANFGNQLTPMIALRWKQYQKKLMHCQSKYAPDFYQLPYENFVSNPEENFSSLCTFLGIDFHPQSLHFYNFKEKIISMYGDDLVRKNHSSLLKPISADHIYDWKKTLHPGEVKMAELICGPTGIKLGYTYSRKRNYWLAIFILPLYFHFALQWLIGLFLYFVPKHKRMKIHFSDSLFLILYEKLYCWVRKP